MTLHQKRLRMKAIEACAVSLLGIVAASTSQMFLGQG
jgi:hypothetical protein